MKDNDQFLNVHVRIGDLVALDDRLRAHGSKIIWEAGRGETVPIKANQEGRMQMSSGDSRFECALSDNGIVCQWKTESMETETQKKLEDIMTIESLKIRIELDEETREVIEDLGYEARWREAIDGWAQEQAQRLKAEDDVKLLQSERDRLRAGLDFIKDKAENILFDNDGLPFAVIKVTPEEQEARLLADERCRELEEKNEELQYDIDFIKERSVQPVEIEWGESSGRLHSVTPFRSKSAEKLTRLKEFMDEQ